MSDIDKGCVSQQRTGLGELPYFSVVVPAFNAESTLSETLRAILAQTHQDWECIVVDDGSTDSTQLIAASFCSLDSRFSFVSQENRGTGGAYNTGVKAAVGTWVSICSADDILLSRHLEVVAGVTDRRAESDIITCNGYFQRADGTQEICYREELEERERSWTLEQLMDRCFYSVGACYRRELHERIGGYREDSYTEDYDFWLRAMAAGARHLYIPDALAVHRISDTQKTRSLRRVFESDIKSIRSVLDEGTLTTSQVHAAQRAIRSRKRMIANLRVNCAKTRLRRLVSRIQSRLAVR